MSQSRYLFLHHVKTGGKTVEKFLLRKFMDQYCKTTTVFSEETIDNIFSINNSKDQTKINILNNAKAVSGHFTYGIHEMLEGESKYFTLLRDPVARTRSFYAYSLINKGSKIHRYLHDNNISFEQFIEMEQKDIQKAEVHELNYVLENGQSKVMSGEDIIIGDKYRTDDLLQLVENNIKKDFQFIGVTEMFDDSFIEINKLLRLSIFNLYITQNRSTVKVEVSDAARKIILERNSVDSALHSKYMKNISKISESFEHKITRTYLKMGNKAADIYVDIRN